MLKIIVSFDYSRTENFYRNMNTIFHAISIAKYVEIIVACNIYWC